jgi:hypothetical protein
MPERPRWQDFANSEHPDADFVSANSSWEAESLSRHHFYPKPHAIADIAAAVVTKINDDGTITYGHDFEIVDDDPTPDEVLAKKRETLHSQIISAEEAAVDRVSLSPGKRRAAELLDFDIRVEDDKVKSILRADGHDEGEAQAEMIRRRKPEHTKHLQDQEDRKAKVDVIRRIAAKAMSEVDDLTLDAIDSFQLPTFEV